MADFFRLILLVLFLPIILILIGPLLIVAVLRGRQPIGPITLNTSRYGFFGRSSALILGLAVWILVWGGLAWLAMTAFLPPTVVVWLPFSPTATATVSNTAPTPSPPLASATPTGVPTSIPLMETPPEPAAPTFTSTPTLASPSPTATPPDPTDTSTPLPTATALLTATATKTQTPATPTSTPSPAATAQPAGIIQTVTGTPGSPTLTPQGAPLSLSQQQAVIEVVEEANLLLREAMTLANEENLQEMEAVWQGLALNVARNFATEIYEKYAKPVQVKFEYLKPPSIEPESTPDEVIVTSREKWTYGGPTQFDREEAFQFIYTLEQKEGQWVITRYTYRNLPVPPVRPEATPTSSEQS